MANEQEFLDLYKEVEEIFRSKRIEWREYEDVQEETVKNKMRICRFMRNFISHNRNDGFIEISDKQILFLKELIDKQKNNVDILRSYLVPVELASCEVHEKCRDVLLRFSKLNAVSLPIYQRGKGILGAITSSDAGMEMIKDKAALAGNVPIKTSNVKCCAPNTSIHTVREQPSGTVICCTDTGKPDGKFLGVYFVK